MACTWKLPPRVNTVDDGLRRGADQALLVAGGLGQSIQGFLERVLHEWPGGELSLGQPCHRQVLGGFGVLSPR
ncbi:hypothetical protein [Arthrobacter methylotrophus]|uniref:hypothetical protein n=1 Tax=Arthrobacter methylotrophus TaxID=121291 RepID=UPI0031E54C01